MSWKVFLNQDPRFSSVYERVGGKPAWPTMAALFCGALVVVVPVVLALLAGLAVGLVVYAVASVIAGIGGWFAGLGGGSSKQPAMPGDELRENVRVMQR
ncbi:hypothetical protein [Algisphaera agarilytica]|uniref:VIT1/CCC1 family predicted Fe2+/Mn2+ transporter n=1 Tax=Algisphaera agarilytica TaxID=1385975 RepID=A0A7X0H958_9BACT|nr:hypothetical protein [Algisphaera agarilytica]MBB6430074.1 VIT1/CCC1 family predicted Fe2+/Mn2+ transporter [Algisphaera agarilytica]